MNELRGLLSAMGAPVSATSQLDKDALERKLRHAIGYAQNMPEFTGKMPVNPIQLSVWQTLGGKPAVDAFKRTSIAEAMEIGRAEMAGGDANTAFPVFKNTFMDLRQTLMSLALRFDEGRRVALLQDDQQQSSIALRMLGAYALDTETPLISLIYETASSPGEMTTGKMAYFMGSQVHGAPGAQITCTPQEQALIRRLLKFNSTKLAPEFEASLTADQRFFQCSFVLPVAPLNKVQIGRIMHDTGCAMCGAAQSKHCSGCKIERYCSSACQKAHWKTHKETCRRMQGGTWTDFTFTDAPTFKGQKLSIKPIDLSSTPSRYLNNPMQEGPGEVDPPPNKHSDRAFLLKIQCALKLPGSMPDVPPTYSFYDRQRFLDGYLESSTNAAAWPAFQRQMPQRGVDWRMYRWAKRTGDWTISICLDREPTGETPPW